MSITDRLDLDSLWLIVRELNDRDLYALSQTCSLFAELARLIFTTRIKTSIKYRLFNITGIWHYRHNDNLRNADSPNCEMIGIRKDGSKLLITYTVGCRKEEDISCNLDDPEIPPRVIPDLDHVPGAHVEINNKRHRIRYNLDLNTLDTITKILTTCPNATRKLHIV